MGMPIPHPDLLVTELGYRLSKSLIRELDVDESWRLVAEAFNGYRGTCIFSRSYLRTLEQGSSPSTVILNEIGNRLCTVKIMCEILAACELYNALALLKEPELAVITQQPGSDIEGTLYIPQGTVLQLKCQATGLPPPRYIWYQDNHELKDQTSNVLLIKEFSEQHEGEYYCCVIQDVEDDEPYQVESDTVNVEMLPTPPTILEQPVPRVVCNVGDDVTLSCIAVAHPEPEYEWFKDNSQLLGEHTSILHITSVKLQDKGKYRCYIKNRSAAVWSNQSIVSVISDVSTESQPRITATVKVALLIGNDTYDNLSGLKNPSNDVDTIAAILKSIGFKVLALQNLTLNEMRNAVREFCKLLSQGAYGLFYFVGHGFEFQDKFMLPVDSPGPCSYLRSHSLCEKEVLRDVAEVNPRLFVILLDMCLKVPDRKENPNIHNELPEAIKYVPQRNLIQHYATTSNLSAYENSSEENGIYVKYLKQHLANDLPISVNLFKVQQGISNDRNAAAVQMPSQTFNVVEEFYLTDAVTGHEEIEARFQKLMTLPPEDTVVFRNVKFTTAVKVEPHRGCFHNALDVVLANVGRWHVTCQMACEKLKFVATLKDDLLITIYNLQKTKMPLVLSIRLWDQATRKLVDSCTLDLQLPLITQAQLWYNPRENNEKTVQ